MKTLMTTAAPHILAPFKTNAIMLDVIIALMPALIASSFIFGPRALLVTLVSVMTCVVSEFVYRKLLKKKTTIGDLSAVVTGILLAFNMPVHFPVWATILTAAATIILLKELFGGLGFNLINPAMGGRALLRVFMVVMLGLPIYGQLNPRLAFDAIGQATPMVYQAAGMYEIVPSYWALFLGFRFGTIGETSKVALLIGGLYLMYKRVITWHIPITYIGSVFVLAFLFGQDPLFSILTGGIFLGGFFMATDYATSPMTKRGKIIFAVGIAVITMGIRLFGVFYDGIAFGIITMNLLVPFIEKITKPKALGVYKEVA
ncbi:MAG: RnfABCDGE type electron transport complex subunit D [Defluviitaleaceae bacterium]|nr:RnfABCDGE type electron transport complex subunit D [Defluviitaleaceae bacterium]